MGKASVSPFKNTDEKKKDKKSNGKWKVFALHTTAKRKKKERQVIAKPFVLHARAKRKAIKAIAKLSVLRANVQTIMLMCSICQMLYQMSIFKYFQSVFRIRNYLRKTFKADNFKNITSF